ncbi:hypothetical protein [Francisella philomiragia]|uniref:hypothetical protein n=1 Tax=Francisella philomiragia TaxID=28110 RepID=UPI0019052A88|nr:hypothetical protein [Francisella philomiragia]MBK2026191.1 hypothetical protein [Francisella philomiragia]
MPHIRLTNIAAKKLKIQELHQPDDSCIPFYLDWIIHIANIRRLDVAICGFVS